MTVLSFLYFDIRNKVCLKSVLQRLLSSEKATDCLDLVMSLDCGYRGQGPGRRDPDPSSGTRRNRSTKFCPPPKDDSARLSEGVGAMSGGIFATVRQYTIGHANDVLYGLLLVVDEPCDSCCYGRFSVASVEVKSSQVNAIDGRRLF